MGLRSIKVLQPEFSEWVIRRRQELNLSPSDLREKLNYGLSGRTLKYLEDGKKGAFSEYTLTILAQGLDLSYAELLKQIEELNSASSVNGLRHRGGHFAKKLSFTRVILFWLIGACVLIFITISGGFNSLFNQITQMTGFNITGFGGGSPMIQGALIDAAYPQIIFAYDEKGNRLWQKNLQTPIMKVAVADLDKNGGREIIAATGKDSHAHWGERPGWLFAWSEEGELLTEQNMGKPSIYQVEESHVTIVDFDIVDLDRDEKPEIVVIIRGQEYYPSRLAILHYENSVFKEVKTFWNPGFLNELLIEDLDGDGYVEIVCAAINNDLKRLPEFPLKENVRALFMLQGRSIFGQAPPYLGDAPQGSQIWYFYLTPPSSSDASHISGLSVSGESDKLILVKLKDTCFFYLNYTGEIVDRFYGDNCRGEAEMHLIPNEQRFTNVYDSSTSP